MFQSSVLSGLVSPVQLFGAYLSTLNDVKRFLSVIF